MNKITFQSDFKEVVEHIRQSIQKTYAQINTTLIELYWVVKANTFFGSNATSKEYIKVDRFIKGWSVVK